ncbi:hypothetical protein RRG08_010695 [Elysia crispata]|uniref:Uncharacterized protein n=1 Tax=Elysia crispata TaxID=231223 RepID=A0AAE0YYP0_9GAST|nr:hypothetical protein RRG08_010695 [Elysia crispata]
MSFGTVRPYQTGFGLSFETLGFSSLAMLPFCKEDHHPPVGHGLLEKRAVSRLTLSRQLCLSVLGIDLTPALPPQEDSVIKPA